MLRNIQLQFIPADTNPKRRKEEVTREKSLMKYPFSFSIHELSFY